MKLSTKFYIGAFVSGVIALLTLLVYRSMPSKTTDGITYEFLNSSAYSYANNGKVTYLFHEEFTQLNCNLNELDELYCYSNSTTDDMAIRMGGPAPAPIELPELTDEEIASIQAEAEQTPPEERVMSWTSFEPCGRYHGAVSVLETLGDFDITCTAESSFAITLPQAIDTLSCSRDSYGWGCGTAKGMSFWFYLTP